MHTELAGMRGLIVTHGDLGKELIASAHLVVASEFTLSILSNRGRGKRELQQLISQWLQDGSGPAVIMVDEGLGSCGTAACVAASGRRDTWVLSGVNLSMVVTYLSRVGWLAPAELVEKVTQRAREAVRIMELEL
jgi:mannose/fructose-specific phosphotransferase system component IIA